MQLNQLYILSSTANATLFFPLTFKIDKLSENIVPNQHQTALKIFVCYQIRGFSSHALEHVSGYKYSFSVPRARGLEMFKNICVLATYMYMSNFGWID